MRALEIGVGAALLCFGFFLLGYFFKAPNVIVGPGKTQPRDAKGRFAAKGR